MIRLILNGALYSLLPFMPCDAVLFEMACHFVDYFDIRDSVKYMYVLLNSLPNNKILDKSKLKALDFAGDKINMSQERNFLL